MLSCTTYILTRSCALFSLPFSTIHTAKHNSALESHSQSRLCFEQSHTRARLTASEKCKGVNNFIAFICDKIEFFELVEPAIGEFSGAIGLQSEF